MSFFIIYPCPYCTKYALKRLLQNKCEYKPIKVEGWLGDNSEIHVKCVCNGKPDIDQVINLKEKV